MKRANGSGSIVRLSGNRRRPYMVRISERDEYGHIIQRALSYHEKAADAQAALEEYNRNRLAGTAPAVGRMNATLQEVFDGWKARSYPKLKPQSIASHNAAWNKRVSRYAARRIRDIGIDDWQQLLDACEDEGLSQSTIQNVALLIKSLCSYAMERDILGKDYSRYLDIPSVDAKVIRSALADLQLQKLEALAQAGEPWADTAVMLCYTGFRISEFLQLTRFSYHSEDGGYLQGGLKSDAGRDRIIPFHPRIRPYLEHWLARGGDTIICDSAGHAISGRQYREYFSSLMDQIGAHGATPHWCRHTFATKLYAANLKHLSQLYIESDSTFN